MRKLDDQFMSDLINYSLGELLDTVRRDHTLCLEIRENYINIYYRGGNILCVSRKNGLYVYEFDTEYFNHDRFMMPNKPQVPTSGPISDYLALIPQLKQEMDRWFVFKKENLEREYQQIILRENNFARFANDTDYYISDIEYSSSENSSRFDIVGIKWISDSSSRKNRKSPQLSLMELKYGDKSLTNSSGIVKHFQDIEKFISSGKYASFVQEVEAQFNQKIELGLISEQSKPIQLNVDAKPEYVMIFANHKPASTILNRELRLAMKQYPNITSRIDIKIAYSSFMGYGLYASEMISIDDYLRDLPEEAGTD